MGPWDTSRRTPPLCPSWRVPGADGRILEFASALRTFPDKSPHPTGSEGPQHRGLKQKKTKVSEIARYLTHKQSVDFWSTNIWPKEDPADVDQSKYIYMIYRDVFPGKRTKSSSLCWEKSESIPSYTIFRQLVFKRLDTLFTNYRAIMSCSCQRRHPEVLRFGKRPFFFPWICFRCLDKVKKTCVPKWWFNGEWFIMVQSNRITKKNKFKFVFEDSKENLSGSGRMVSKKFLPKTRTPKWNEAQIMASQEAFLRDSTIKPFFAKFHLNS